MSKSKRKERSKDKDRDGERKAKKRRREDDGAASSVTARASSKRSEDTNSSSSMRRKHSSRRDNEVDNHKHHRKKESSKKDEVEKKKSKKKKDSRERRKEDHNRKHKQQREDDEVKQLKDQSTSSAVEGVIEISKKDYFTRVKEFRVWLFLKRKTYFEDLSSVKSHELFDKFVRDWNRGKLESEFYEDRLPEELVTSTKKTQHKWGFVEKLSDRDQMQLASTNDSVQSSTEKVEGVRSNAQAAPAGSSTSSKRASSMPPPPPRARAGGGGGDEGGGEGGRGRRGREGQENGDDREERRRERKRQRKLEMEKHTVVLDEIAPKETGRQATQDKRREVGTRTHAAAKQREQNADGLDMKEADIMGGGDSFHDAVKRSHGAKKRRQEAQQELIQELAAKEQEKRAALMAQLGLKPGQKITIQPRRDG